MAHRLRIGIIGLGRRWPRYRRALAALAEGRLPPELADLARRRVVLDLPKRYY